MKYETCPGAESIQAITLAYIIASAADYGMHIIFCRSVCPELCEIFIHIL